MEELKNTFETSLITKLTPEICPHYQFYKNPDKYRLGFKCIIKCNNEFAKKIENNENYKKIN